MSILRDKTMDYRLMYSYLTLPHLMKIIIGELVRTQLVCSKNQDLKKTNFKRCIKSFGYIYKIGTNVTPSLLQCVYFDNDFDMIKIRFDVKIKE